jgi:hypothetical protein
MLSDAQWVVLEPLVEVGRPRGKTLPQDLRRTALHHFVAASERGQVVRHSCRAWAPREPLGGSRPAGRMIGAADHAGAPPRSLFSGRGSGSGSACSASCRRAASRSAWSRRGDLKSSEAIVKRLAVPVAATAPRLA